MPGFFYALNKKKNNIYYLVKKGEGCNFNKIKFVIPLPEKYNKHSYNFELIKRSENVAIMQQTDPENENRFVAYEVFRIRKFPERMIMGRKYPPAELPPNSEKWGIYGFSCRTWDEAMLRFNQLESLNESRAKLNY